MKPFVRRFLPLLFALVGCHTPPPADVPTAECPVCRREGDLACLRVAITPDTPSCEIEGHRYWFCSEECREAFLTHPAPPPDR